MSETPIFDDLVAARRLARIKAERARREPITRVVDEARTADVTLDDLLAIGATLVPRIRARLKAKLGR